MLRSMVVASLCLMSGAGPLAASAQASHDAVSDTNTSPPLVDPRPVDAANAVTIKAGDVPQPLGSVAPNVQPDVTVHGQPLREPCKPRDQACIHAVTAEIWRRYPEQIKQLCLREETYKFKEGFILQDMGVEGANLGRMSPQTQMLCDYGARMKRRQQRADADAKAAAAGAGQGPEP